MPHLYPDLTMPEAEDGLGAIDSALFLTKAPRSEFGVSKVEMKIIVRDFFISKWDWLIWTCFLSSNCFFSTPCSFDD